ncbi:hypothetical protein ACS0TY_013661 [Phlomoides rotata]
MAPDNIKAFTAENAEIMENLNWVLSVNIDTIYYNIKDRNWLSVPRKIYTEKNKLNKRKLCSYHGDIGHFTSECRDLLWQLWKFYEDGKLAEFVNKQPAKRPQPRGDNGDDKDEDEDRSYKKKQAPPMLEGGQQREILMLQPDLGPVRGCSEWGILMSKRKRKVEVQALN